ncbi:MAG: phosphonoacetaldehyde reductase [Lachnospiraceae bacterium]|nr:phosphonoacetaldehyde reductase [Lachnospiraceae bacterium]
MGQQIILTTEVVERLNNIFDSKCISKVLLVCDSAFDYLQTKEEYLKIKVEYVFFNQFTSNPFYEDVVEGVKVFKDSKCDAIVAIGGGSAIDVAKCIKLYSGMSDSSNYLEQECKENEVPLIAIPTTSGTGSESTKYAVIYYEGKKQSVTHDSLVPEYAILDYRNLITLPLYQKKCTMMDALCQSIESWWSVNATEESRVYSKKALQMIMANMKGYLENSTDGNANMLIAANYAGQAINITQTTAAHAMSYKLTSLYGIPHGRAVFMCLPYIWKYMAEKNVLLEEFLKIAEALGCKNVNEAINLLYKMNDELFEENKVVMDSKDINILVESVNPTRLKNNPLPLLENEIRDLYNQIMEKYI